MEKKKVKVRFLKSANLIDPDAIEGKTVRNFAKDAIAEVTIEEFAELVRQRAVVPAGEMYGGVVKN